MSLNDRTHDALADIVQPLNDEIKRLNQLLLEIFHVVVIDEVCGQAAAYLFEMDDEA